MKSSRFRVTGRRWLRVLLATISAIAFSGCSLSQFESEAAQVPQLVQHIVGDIKTFNYAISDSLPSVFSLTYDGMITTNGLTGEVEPALAESWEISEDKKQIIFTLREGLKWSDGEPLTADDVIFTYNNIYFNEAIPTGTRDILRIGESRALPSVRKIDQRRVEITVPEPFAPFLRIGGGQPILPKHALEASVKTKDSQGNPQFLSKWGTDTDPKEVVWNGPYTVESYQTNERVVFQRNPYYWRKDSQGNPQPYIDRVVWEIVENTDTALLQFRSGGLDTLEISAASFGLLKREEKRSNFTIYEGGPDTGRRFIMFNLNQGSRNGKPVVDPVKASWFNTVAFRQAVSYAIDRPTMINNIYRGLGESQDSPIPVQSPYYLSPAEGLKTYEYNLEQAKELLLGAGFKYNSQNQLEDAQGNRVRFTLLAGAGSQTGDAIGSQIKRDLSEIGIQVDFQPIAFSTLVDKLSNTLEWDCAMLGFTAGIEPNTGANLWLPDGNSHLFNQQPQAGQPPLQGREVADWEAELGQLYIQAAQELDEAKRKAIYGKTQILTQEYLPLIYLVNTLSLAAVRDRVEGVQYSALGGTNWNIYELQVQKR
ncbi:ABC transporter substrate-binding protein [Lyngbya aestuarii]|uniref:ABC transporter substrate-binding protein n=1 Tax=Lyngbya aestuarii TaxID=118322 RepID=UPI00403DE5FF